MQVDGSKKIPAVLRILSAAAAAAAGGVVACSGDTCASESRSAWFARDTTHKACKTWKESA